MSKPNSTIEVGFNTLWVLTHHHHPRQTFRPLPDHPGSWFSACKPILTKLYDLWTQKNYDPNFFLPKFFWPNIFFDINFFDPKKFPTQILFDQKKFWPKFFWPNIFFEPKFCLTIFILNPIYLTQIFWTQFIFYQQSFGPKKIRLNFFLP